MADSQEQLPEHECIVTDYADDTSGWRCVDCGESGGYYPDRDTAERLADHHTNTAKIADRDRLIARMREVLS